MASIGEKTRDAAIAVAYMVLAALPAIAMALGLSGHTLYGVLSPAPRPELELASVVSERFQHAFAAWFETGLGLKGTSIACDNALLYHAFGETKPGATVRLGKDRVLFNQDDIDFFNRPAHVLPRPTFLQETADKVRELQQLLAGRGQAFVPVIVPGKASIWRDMVADEWRVALGERRPSDHRVYQGLVRVLDMAGVRYVDMREKLANSSEPRALLFGADARHWSDYGACMAMDDVASLYAELTGKPRPAHAAEMEMVPATLWGTDFDLWRLLNALLVPRSVETTPSMRHSPPPSGAPRPSVLFVGTSFCRTLIHDAESSGLYGVVHFNYYNTAFEASPFVEQLPLEPESDLWHDITLDKDLYVLELFEVYLDEGEYFDLFLRDLLAGLQGTR